MPPDNISVWNTAYVLHLSNSTSWLLRKRKRVKSNSFSTVISSITETLNKKSCRVQLYILIRAKLLFGNNVNPENNTQALHLVYILNSYATGGNNFVEKIYIMLKCKAMDYKTHD